VEGFLLNWGRQGITTARRGPAEVVEKSMGLGPNFELGHHDPIRGIVQSDGSCEASGTQQPCEGPGLREHFRDRRLLVVRLDHHQAHRA